MRALDNSDINRKPDAEIGDVVHTVAKAGLSAIPVVGGPLAETFAAIFVQPLSKRRDEWVESIARRLLALEEKVNGFKIESLSQDETFITTLMQASQAALRNHQEEKLEALANAVLNTAIANAPEEDLQLMFLNFVDSFTTWHLRMLKFFDDPQEWGRRNPITYPSWSMGGSPAVVLEYTFPEFKGRRSFYDQIVKDLFARGLMNTDSLHGNMTTQGMFARRTTDMGKQFLSFIAAPPNVGCAGPPR